MKKRMCMFLLIIMLLLSCITSCGKAEVQRFQKTDFVMDTVLNITIYGQEDSSDKMKEALSKLEKESLSWREVDSMASRINASGEQGSHMDESFAAWTRMSLDLARKSGGAFDPTIGNLTRLWNIEGENPHVPDQTDIEACMKDSGYEHIIIEDTQIKLEGNVTLDLGAVGKGIGCDVIAANLENNGKAQEKEMEAMGEGNLGAVVAIGGSILVWGEKPDGSDWTVAVQDPAAEDGVAMGAISLKGKHFISTSGDYEKYFIEDGKRYHHILDPSTGYPSESGLRSVTIVCDNGLLSDGLSTACFVLGLDQGMELVRAYGAEAVFINEENEVFLTDGLKENFQILDKKYEISTLPGVS